MPEKANAGRASQLATNLAPILRWLQKNIPQVGFRLSAEDLVTQLNGRELTEVDFLERIKEKYSLLYRL